MINKPAIMHLAMLGAIVAAFPAQATAPLNCLSLGAGDDGPSNLSCESHRPSDLVEPSLKPEPLNAVPDLKATVGTLNWIEIRFDNREPSNALGVQPTISPVDAVSTLSASPPGSVANTSAIPEPKIWALLLLGLGAAGLTLRRRQKASSFV